MKSSQYIHRKIYKEVDSKLGMASHHTTFKRLNAIEEIRKEFNLINLPEDSLTWQQWNLEVCAKWDVTPRTADEYMRVARAKQIYIKKQWDEEQRKSAAAEADNILNAKEVDNADNRNEDGKVPSMV